MSPFVDTVRRHPALRWVAPATAVAVVAAVGLVIADSATAAGQPVLPPRSAEQLLTDVLQPTTQAVSGTVSLKADLGLPQLPALAGAVTGTGVVPDSAASLAPGTSSSTTPPALNGLIALLSGTSTLRVWADGPDHSRVQVIAAGQESDVVHNGTDVWVWDSAGRQAYHATVPSPGAMPTPTPSLPAGLLTQLPTTPAQAATMALAALDPSTTVATDSTASIAGRPAYRLVATPKTPGSLVARVVVAIDATTHVPLRVDVYSTQRTAPAFSVGFTDVSFATPAADVFAFTPPAGATVTQAPKPPTTSKTAPDTSAGTGTHPKVRTVGTGWATVVVVPASAAQKPPTGGVLEVLPRVSGTWGSGHALSGTLFSVLIKDDGTMAVGAVPVETLEGAVASTGSGSGQ